MVTGTRTTQTKDQQQSSKEKVLAEKRSTELFVASRVSPEIGLRPGAHSHLQRNLLSLQRTIGNRALSNSLQRGLAAEDESSDQHEEDDTPERKEPSAEPEKQSQEVESDGAGSPSLSASASAGDAGGGMCSRCADEAKQAPYWGSSNARATAGEPSIAVTQKAKSLTKCGSAESKVKWSVSGKPNGWIIQHVFFRASATDCKGNKVATVAPNGLSYWEGWEVKKGKVFVGFAAGGSPHNADTFRTGDQGAGSKGRATIRGEVKFFRNYKLTVPPWGFTVPQAMSLPTVTKAPKGWSTAGASTHNLIVMWNCCGKTNHQVVSGTP